jgi:ABC-2 type transport system permease protein
MRPYLKADLDFYLSRRGKGDAERPLAEVRLHQAHIAYKKGAVAMYAIKDAIGQEAIDRALRRYLEKFRNSSRPYPVANDFLTILREEAGPDHQALISDLFDTIVLWEFNLLQANASPTSDGKWKVSVVAGGRKVTADASGSEQSMPLYDDVDIGLFETDPSSRDFTSRDVIALEKRRISNATMHFEFTTNRRPRFAGINPYLKLIEREPRDNLIPVTIIEQSASEEAEEQEAEEDNLDPAAAAPLPNRGSSENSSN